ncbi:uncharacterized protein V6R79_024509 [Siganus canaliculatus]
MNKYIGKRCCPQMQLHFAADKHGSVCTEAQHGKKGEIDKLFPNKAVGHRRHLNNRTQGSHDLMDFEKITIARQPKVSLLYQKHHSDDIKHTSAPQHPRRNKHNVPSEELKMDRAIQAKELMLQEKLQRVEEKIRQKMQREKNDSVAGGDPKLEKSYRKQAAHGKAQPDVIQQQAQRNDAGARNTPKKERTRGTGTETANPQSLQLQRRGQQTITMQDNVIKHVMNKRETEKDCSSHNQDIIQMSQEKTSHGAAEIHNHRGKKLPPISSPSHSGRAEQEVHTVKAGTDHSPELLPCRVCKRTFVSERLEMHVQICQNRKQRPVYNSYLSRVKESALEGFLKTHGRCETPEIFQKKKPGLNQKANTRTVPQRRRLDETSQTKRSK